MSLKFTAKLFQYIHSRKSSKGFTLIELLVVIIIIGILSAIALPSFLNQSIKAKQSEAKLYVSSINRGQQIYFTEKQQFASSYNLLSLGIPKITSNYTYDTSVGISGTTEYALNTGVANFNILKAHGGLVVAKGDTGSLSILCEAFLPSASGGTQTPTLANAFKPFPSGIPECNDVVAQTGFISIR